MNLLSIPNIFLICDQLLKTEYVLNIQNNFIKCIFHRGRYFEYVNILLKREYISNFKYFLNTCFLNGKQFWNISEFYNNQNKKVN